MYIGGIDSKALHHLVYEILDNSIDETLAGFCDEIRVILHSDIPISIKRQQRLYNSVSIFDNGRSSCRKIHEINYSKRCLFSQYLADYLYLKN